jgi:uncharacterized protein YndB with AHSA1/START domain
MATGTRSAATTLKVTRAFRAPCEKVFRAWTDPEALKQWWGPPGYECPDAEVDLGAGGKYRLAMRKVPDGEVFYLTGAYREVRPPQRLVYTWRWESQPDLGETLVTVEFLDRAGATEVVLTHELFPSQAARDDHDKGWSGCLDRLAASL